MSCCASMGLMISPKRSVPASTPTRLGRPSLPPGVYFRLGELLERPCAHLYETGGLRRAHVRGHENVLKRLLLHAGAFNLGLWMRTLFGIGTPRSLQGRAVALGAVMTVWSTLFNDLIAAILSPRRDHTPIESRISHRRIN